MASVRETYDSTLLGILSNEGEITNFLDVVIGFLYRRTDFFRIMKRKDDKLGFPPGTAAKLLLKEFQKYEALAQRDEMEREKKKADKSLAKAAPTQPPVTRETTTTSKTNIPATVSTPQATAPQATTTTVPSTGGAGDVKTLPSQKKDEDTGTVTSKEQQAFQDNPMSYNGAVREKYVWSQSITDADIRIFVPPYIKKGKQVEVTIEKRHLRVCYRDDKNVSQTVVDGNLTWDVNKEECMWSLVPAEHVHVSLEKREERWWESALEDEPKINVRNIDCSRPMTDLDDEAQAKIGEMMFNEQQKRQGLPQSHEQKQHEMLRKAWDAEGSPFKGQPFDPSVLNINSEGVISANVNKS
ncbi:nudC domain-containing protein 3-like [Haliotis cracherodii]|uniref:nudC domain-containing protein 3-like n=1 Tax=Haliotis cracherodii TaxID=6455 RepID=UPI0039ED2215